MAKGFKTLLFVSAFSIATFSYSSGHSADFTALDEDSITAFIEQTNLIAKGAENYMDDDEIEEYLDNHIHDDAYFTSKVQLSMPGMPPQETKFRMKKDEFITNVKESDEAVNEYENAIEIVDIQFSKDRKIATVHTIGTEMAQMPADFGTGQEEIIPIEGVSECKQVLMLEDGYIQMFNADCVTTIEMDSFF